MICQGCQRNTPEYMLCPLRMSDCPELRSLGTMEKREVCIAIMDGFRERVNRILRSTTARPYVGCQICDGPHQLQVGMGPSGVNAQYFTTHSPGADALRLFVPWVQTLSPEYSGFISLGVLMLIVLMPHYNRLLSLMSVCRDVTNRMDVEGVNVYRVGMHADLGIACRCAHTWMACPRLTRRMSSVRTAATRSLRRTLCCASGLRPGAYP
jgi:hypothetical protein